MLYGQLYLTFVKVLRYKEWSNLAESKPSCFLTLLTGVGG